MNIIYFIIYNYLDNLHNLQNKRKNLHIHVSIIDKYLLESVFQIIDFHNSYLYYMERWKLKWLLITLSETT